MVKTEQQRALAALHAAGRLQVVASVPDVVHDDEPTAPGPAVPAAVDEAAPLPPPPVASLAADPDRRLHEHAVRLRERLGAVRPALARLRDELVRASLRMDAPLVELALADVERALVLARRSVRALLGELADLEREARALGGVATAMIEEHTPERGDGGGRPRRRGLGRG